MGKLQDWEAQLMPRNVWAQMDDRTRLRRGSLFILEVFVVSGLSAVGLYAITKDSVAIWVGLGFAVFFTGYFVGLIFWPARTPKMFLRFLMLILVIAPLAVLGLVIALP